MVKIVENPMKKMDDLGGFTTPIFGNTQMAQSTYILRSRKHMNLHVIDEYFQKYGCILVPGEGFVDMLLNSL